MAANDVAQLVVAIVSLLVALGAFGIAWFAAQRSDRNASAATLVTLNEGFRQGWRRYLDETASDRRNYELAELVNLFEIACATYLDKAIHGHSRELLEDYLCRTLTLIAENTDARQQVVEMTEAPTTFKYLALFLSHMRRTGRTHLIELIITPYSR